MSFHTDGYRTRWLTTDLPNGRKAEFEIVGFEQDYHVASIQYDNGLKEKSDDVIQKLEQEYEDEIASVYFGE